MLHLLYVDQSSISDLVLLKGKLNRLGYGTKDTAFCATSIKDYSLQLDDMEKLRQCSMLVVANRKENELIDKCQTLRILAAMLWNRPIIFTSTPVFCRKVPSYYKEMVMRRLNKMVIGDLYSFDETDTQTLLQNVSGDVVNYVLTMHEKTLIRAMLRRYFASILRSSK